MTANPDSLERIGALCFGLAVGFITYRTLVRTTDKATVGDLAAVIGAIGGGAITALFKPQSDLFAWYAIGLLGGMVVFFLLFWAMNGRAELAKVMGSKIRIGGGQPGGDTDAGRGPGAPQG